MDSFIFDLNRLIAVRARADAEVRELDKQFLYDVRLTPRFDEHFMRGDFCIVVWAQSVEAAVSAVENAIGGGAAQELYTVEAKPLKAYNTEVFRVIHEKESII